MGWWYVGWQTARLFPFSKRNSKARNPEISDVANSLYGWIPDKPRNETPRFPRTERRQNSPWKGLVARTIVRRDLAAHLEDDCAVGKESWMRAPSHGWGQRV